MAHLLDRILALYQRSLLLSNLGPIEIALYIGEMARRCRALVTQMEEIDEEGDQAFRYPM